MTSCPATMSRSRCAIPAPACRKRCAAAPSTRSFTTKPLGKGTGLGLSMTFGFVRQSRRLSGIESKPGQGTISPCHAALSGRKHLNGRKSRSGRGGRSDAAGASRWRCWRIAGFQVFEAGDGIEAMELLKANPDIRSWSSTSRCRAWMAMPWSRLASRQTRSESAADDRLRPGTAATVLKAREIQILHKPFNLEVLCAWRRRCWRDPNLSSGRIPRLRCAPAPPVRNRITDKGKKRSNRERCLAARCWISDGSKVHDDGHSLTALCRQWRRRECDR